MVSPSSLQTVQALLETGCDVTLVDNQGLTAAELADKCDQSEAAALIRGEVTLDQLQVEESFSDQELSVSMWRQSVFCLVSLCRQTVLSPVNVWTVMRLVSV